MDKRKQAIIEDLLPLYNEGLLSAETTTWLEEQIQDNQELQKLMHQAMTPLEKDKIESPVQHDKMITNIKRRLALYQLILLGYPFSLPFKHPCSMKVLVLFYGMQYLDYSLTYFTKI